jgi:hypothetical protein
LPFTLKAGTKVNYEKTDNGYHVTCAYGSGLFSAFLDLEGNALAGDKVVYCMATVMKMAWKLHRAGYKFNYALKYAWNKAREAKVKVLLAKREYTSFSHNTVSGVKVVYAGASNLHSILVANNAVPKGLRTAPLGTKPYYDLAKGGWRCFKTGTVASIN